MESLVSVDIYLRFFVAICLVFLLIGLAVWIARFLGFNLGYKLGELSGGISNHRIVVLDTVPLDTQRRLVLVRRDNAEHLLCIGGPADIIIEANIKPATANTNQQAINQVQQAAPIPPPPQPSPAEEMLKSGQMPS